MVIDLTLITAAVVLGFARPAAAHRRPSPSTVGGARPARAPPAATVPARGWRPPSAIGGDRRPVQGPSARVNARAGSHSAGKAL